ncbi:MAG TPA: hypothetical protein DIW30_06490 [Bacteroidales bacterium]|nr:hypothetical protein [Bacteroidales bacterium]
MLINKWLYQYTLRKRLHKATAFPDFSRCTRILLVCNEEAWNSLTKPVSELCAAGKNLTILRYANHKLTNLPADHACTTISKKDFTFFGKPRKSLQQILNLHYDLLLDLTDSSTLHTQWIALLAVADFKAGKAVQPVFSGKNKALDFMIQLPPGSGADFLLRQILYYLQHITPQS